MFSKKSILQMLAIFLLMIFILPAVAPVQGAAAGKTLDQSRQAAPQLGQTGMLQGAIGSNQPANNAPIADNQSINTNEDTAQPITLTGSDPEDSPLTFSVVTWPLHGTLSGVVPDLTYTPVANYFGPDIFTFKVNDGALDSVPATISIDVAPVNDAPVAIDYIVMTAGGVPQAFTLSGSDVEGSSLSFTVVSPLYSGTLSGAAPGLTYTPDDCFQGEDSFTYKANDGNLDSLPATVRIIVTDFGVYHTITGRVGIGGATLSYDDDYLGSQSAIADANGNYTILVHSCWAGTVTPSKTGYFFTPANLVYSAPVLGDLVNQNYTAGKVMTYASTGTEDGWVLEATETSNTGGSLNAADKVFTLGDDSSNRQYKAILSFKTTDIPANAIIKSAILKIRQNGGPVGKNPFTQLGKLWVDIRKGTFGFNVLQVNDFQVVASAAKVAYFPNTPAGGWYSAILNAPGRGNINKTGLTQFRLYFATDDNNNKMADFMKFVSGNSATLQPQLIITYTLP
jgi:hypothetical protein